MPVQVFGTKKSADTRKALRFFAERRVPVHFVDLAERAPAKGELQRYVQKFGVQSLVDRTSRRFQELGLGPAQYSEGKWFDLLLEEPFLLVQPLVRHANKLTVGAAETDWAVWVKEGIA